MSYSTNTTILLINPSWPQTTTAGGYDKLKNQIDEHITRADNFINSKIVNRYDISGFDTTGSVPPLLKTLSEDIATFFTMRNNYSNDNQNYNEWVEKYKDAIDMLDEIREGNMDLVNTTGSQIAIRTDEALQEVESSTEDYQSFFDEDGPLDWKVDATKIDNIDSDRS